jgi:hypothetical protein
MDPEICRLRIISEEYRDFIMSVNGSRVRFPATDEQLCMQNTGIGFEIVYADQALVEPVNFDRFSYSTIPQCYALLDMAAMNQAGITQVQNYPTLQLMGNNIMIGFVDTGIDYQNKIFRNLDGTTRIAGIWDQTVQTGKLPEDFAYGSEYTEEMINDALKQENPMEAVPTKDEIGHGTFLASLAAGSADVANGFLGAAPESTIAVVKLKQAKEYLREFYAITGDVPCYQENDIMLGIRYLHRLAERRGLPLVICVALGTSFGGQNATTPLDIMLEMYSVALNRAVVIGVGNEANQRHHYFGKIENMEERKEVEIQVGEGTDGFCMELWTDLPNILTLSMISPSGEVVPRISIKQGTNAVFRFLFENTEVYVDFRILVERNNSQLIFFRFRNPTPGIWKILVEPLQLAGGEFHIWLPLKEFLSREIIFLEPEPNTTLTSPSTIQAGMAVAYYNGNENSVDINSGRGYTRTGRIKPDIAAPGVNVTGALPGGRFVGKSGSSVATAIAAGASALLMEWIVYYAGGVGADTIQIKNLFILGAEQRPDMEYPNRQWGYGTLDVYHTLQRIREL